MSIITDDDLNSYKTTLFEEIAVSLGALDFPENNNITYDEALLMAIRDNIDSKQEVLVSGANIKTINGDSILGSGDLVVGGGGSTPKPTLNFTVVKDGITATMIPYSLIGNNAGAIAYVANKIVIEDLVGITVTTFNITDVGVTNFNSGNLTGVIGNFTITASTATIVLPNVKIITAALISNGSGGINAPLLEFCGSFSTNGSTIQHSFSNLKAVTTLIASNVLMPVGTLTLPELQYVTNNLTRSDVTRNLVLPKLKLVGANLVEVRNTSTIDYPELEEIIGTWTISTSVSQNLVLTAPKLKRLNGTVTINITGVLDLHELEFVVGNIGGNFNGTGLTSVSTPKIIYNANINFSLQPNLTTVTIGTIGITKQLGLVQFATCALNQVSVDGILALLVSLDGTNGTTLYGAGKNCNIGGGTSSTPSAAGLIDKAILQSRGATITTN